MNRAPRFNWVFSLALHAVIIALLVFWSNKDLSEKAELEKSVEVEIGSFSTPVKPLPSPKIKPGARQGRARGAKPERSQISNDTTGESAVDTFRQMDVQTSAEIYPFLFELYRRIDQDLWYPAELAKNDHEGNVAVDFDVTQMGKIVMPVKAVVSNDEPLRGLVLKTLGEVALREDRHPFDSKHKKIALRANFHFKVRGARSEVAVQDPPVVKNILSFYRYYNSTSTFTAYQGAAGGDPRDRTVLTEVVALWNSLFGKKKLDSMERMKWDIEFKRKEFREACEDRHYEGACERLGYIEKVLGHLEASKRYYAMACSMGVPSACVAR